MSDRELFCNRTEQHSQHWNGRHRCDGVTRDEAAVMSCVVENGYAVAGSLDRDDARLVIAELDKARSVDPDYPMRYTRCPECGSVDVRVLDYGADAPVAPVRACRTPDCRNFRR